MIENMLGKSIFLFIITFFSFDKLLDIFFFFLFLREKRKKKSFKLMADFELKFDQWLVEIGHLYGSRSKIWSSLLYFPLQKKKKEKKNLHVITCYSYNFIIIWFTKLLSLSSCVSSLIFIRLFFKYIYMILTKNAFRSHKQTITPSSTLFFFFFLFVCLSLHLTHNKRNWEAAWENAHSKREKLELQVLGRPIQPMNIRQSKNNRIALSLAPYNLEHHKSHWHR